MTGHKDYDRSRMLETAARATTRRRRRKAIRCYRRVLAAEPQNAGLHLRLAPLLAQTGEHFDAWLSYRIAAKALLRQGQETRAVALHREATRQLPRNADVWCTLARLELKRGRRSEAFEALALGRSRLRRRRERPEAIHLLRQALELEPGHARTTVDLARLLHRSKRREEAWLLLENRAARASGADRRRLRGAQLGLFPSLRHLWLWLRALRGNRRTRSRGGAGIVAAQLVDVRGGSLVGGHR
ncbi:MAG: tetratricopeptide repeat protein [Myxococcota bacterium]